MVRSPTVDIILIWTLHRIQHPGAEVAPSSQLPAPKPLSHSIHVIMHQQLAEIFHPRRRRWYSLLPAGKLNILGLGLSSFSLFSFVPISLVF